jgi:uncharacterized membrane protein
MDQADRIIGRLEEFKVATEKRLDKIEHKIDRLHEYKWRIAGGLAVISALTVAALHLWFD